MSPTDARPSVALADLPDGAACGVCLTDAEGEAVAAVVVRRGDRLYAYRNRCPHNGVRLDFVPGTFLSDDGRHLRCGTHGALFRPDTGKCVRGPCKGKRLESLHLRGDGR
ncbi:Rieske (2Fe-2S) protein [Roseospira navarrensis]|uniref:Rieske (2Fe-2S) protein n=1 Tax=Roseospira navarrensis TaxID=140058 RepID=UPI0031B57DE1